MGNEYSLAEIVRWLERLDNSIQQLIKEQDDHRKEQLKWIWGILSAIVIFALTSLLKGS